MFGLLHTLITCIAIFLSYRSIAVKIGGFVSKPHSISSIVPQGSVISPVLFMLFINDLFSSTSSSIFSFAVSTYLSSSFSSNPPHLACSNISPHYSFSTSLLTNDWTNVEKWDSGNLVKFNEEMTTQSVISHKHHQDSPLFS